MKFSGSSWSAEIELLAPLKWKGKPVPGLISIISALALLLTGAWLIHDGVQGSDRSQIEIIAGATLLSVGVVSSVFLLRGWIKGKRELGKYRAG